MADGSKTSGSKRDSLRALRSDLNAITSRLKAADQATEQSVAALKTALHALAKHGDTDSETAQKRHSELETQIAALQSHLTSMIRDTQKAVNADLKSVLTDPRLSTLAKAIDTADARIRQTETAQAQNLAKLQGYVANLAREVDINLGEERKARQAALNAVADKQDQLQADLTTCTATLSEHTTTLKHHETHLKSIETDTATALRDMGEKIASFAQTATEARLEQQREIKGKVSDIALETQKNFDLYRDGLDRNIEAMQAAHEAAKRDFETDLEALRTRLETLEYGMRPVTGDNIAPHIMGAAPHNGPHNVMTDDAFTPAADDYTLAQDRVMDETHDQTPASPPEYLPQAPMPFTAKPLTDDPANANPYTQSYAPDIQTPYPTVEPVYADPTAGAPYNTENPNMDYGPVETYPETAYPQPQPLPEGSDTGVYTGYNDIPYADPAYAEQQPTMQQVRPGTADHSDTGGAKRSPIFTPSNLRAAVLGVAVLGGSYFAYNKVLGHKAAPDNTPPDNVFVESPSTPELVADNAAAIGSNPTSIQALEPIGNYPEDLNRPIDSSQTARTALEAAAADGNEIAEYQLGLIKLQTGDVDAALSLLRNSANKGQAAAQYRLAKLYETGNGVTKDLVTARELIEKSARSGNRIAMHDLANFYANGIGGTEQDLSLAAKWFEQAAERGVVDSQYNVGYLYEFGIGVTKNLVEAYVWYGIAAEQGDTEAGRRISALNETLSTVEIDSAKKRIDGFKPVKLNKTANGIFKDQPWQSKTADKKIAQAEAL